MVAEPAGSAVRLAPRAAVLGTAAHAPPVAAALANALRSDVGAPAAAVAVWSPAAGASPSAPLPSEAGRPPTRSEVHAGGAAMPAAARLAAWLTARGLPATGRGRLAWLELDDHPIAAALAARRASGALDVPLVVALAGPRCDALEHVIAEQDLVVVVARDAEGALARVAIASCPGPAVACSPLPGGPVSMLALAGWAGARVLGEPVRMALRGRPG